MALIFALINGDYLGAKDVSPLQPFTQIPRCHHNGHKYNLGEILKMGQYHDPVGTGFMPVHKRKNGVGLMNICRGEKFFALIYRDDSG
ncbi:hypothetical protein [Actinobacillus porcinus]|uniref:hypothetical protein n=1 Tax=Actinobacillus porcinus TaxID=51048 RepID=UPI00108427E9|nr:hypothetical protein [Actinobacillus porcinus]